MTESSVNTKMKFKKFLMPAMVGLTVYISGCATMMYPQLQETTSSNFRNRVEIRGEDTVFYSGERRDKSKFCFPPSDKPICSDKYNSKDDYAKKNQLEIENYSISLTDRKAYYSEQIKEYLYLVASELTLQRGFKNFIVALIYYGGSCSNSYSTNTYGSVYGNTYSGTTYLNENTTCSGLMSIDVLLFNKYDDIKAGVFYQPQGYKPESVRPYDNLYLTPKALMDRDPDYRKATIHSPMEAWKSYLDASETAQTLQQKYDVEPFTEYSIKPSFKSKAKPSTIDSLKKTD